MRWPQPVAGTGALFGSLAGGQVEVSPRSPMQIAGGNTLLLSLIAFALITMSTLAVRAESADEAQAAIRAALVDWTRDFNSGKADKVCDLFATDLRYDFRGYPERGYRDICDRLRRSLGDESKSYRYSLDIREILISGDHAVVRLVWTLTVALGDSQEVTSVEPGMDVFRREPDGAWKIVRYMAYEAPGPDVE